MRFFLRLALLPFLCALTFAAQAGFPQDRSDLQADPAVHFGTLPNGVRTVVMANPEPKGRAALRLVFLAGSFMEKDSQQGLAHFLEHMAFNGSKHYPPGTLVEFLQRLGMGFGADTNASTSFDHTAYQIELPDTKPASIAEGLQVFHDYASTLLLEQSQIDKERGIILSEKRTRDSIPYRTFVAEFHFLFGESLLPKRLPIGHTSIIEHANRPLFLDFYNTWYRPERMVVIAVGDFDPSMVEKKITEAFSPIGERAPARPAPSLGTIPEFNGLRVAYHPEPEAASTRISLSTVIPYPKESDTVATRLEYLPRDLAIAILNERLLIEARKAGVPFTSATMRVDDYFEFARQASMVVVCKPDQWQAAVGVAEQELRRTLAYGFQPAELREAVANYRNDLQEAVRTAATRRSPLLARALIDSIVDNQVFTCPQADLALFGPALDKITPEDCLAALRSTWTPANRYLFVTGNCRIEGDPVAAIRAAYTASETITVKPPASVEDSSFAYTQFGKPASIFSRTEVPDLGITEVTFTNGVRLNIKKTDFEKGRIRILVRVGCGRLVEPRSEPGLAAFGSSAFLLGGLGKHSYDDLQRLTAGHTVNTRFEIHSDALQFSGSTNRDDLLFQLQLITAQIADPGYRPEATRMLSKVIDQVYNHMEHTSDGPMQIDVPRLLANGDTRFGLPSRAVMNERTLAELRTWLSPQLQHGAIEVAIDGDLDVEATIATVARSLGALPNREPRPALSAERKVSFPEKPFAKTFLINTRIPKALVAIFWPTNDANDVHRARRLAILADVLTDRLRVKVREQLGDAYSPYAFSEPSDTFTGYGFINAQIVVAPDQAPKVEAVVDTLANDLSKNGVTDDELLRAKQPLLTELRESARTNPYWLNAVLAKAQEKPEVLEWARSRYSDIESVSKPEIDALALRYLPASQAFKVIVAPQ